MMPGTIAFSRPRLLAPLGGNELSANSSPPGLPVARSSRRDRSRGRDRQQFVEADSRSFTSELNRLDVDEGVDLDSMISDSGPRLGLRYPTH